MQAYGGPVEQEHLEITYTNVNQLIEAQYETVADQEKSISNII